MLCFASFIVIAALFQSRDQMRTKKSSSEFKFTMEEFELLERQVDTLLLDKKMTQERVQALQIELDSLKEKLALRVEDQHVSINSANDTEDRHETNTLTDEQKKKIQNLLVHSHTIPRDLWGYAGFKTPEDSFLSTVFAAKEGNFGHYLDSLTKNGKEEAIKYFEGKSEEEIEASMKEMIAPLRAVRLDRVKMTSDTEAVFTIYSTETDDGVVRARGESVLIFKKIKDEWKSDGLF